MGLEDDLKNFTGTEHYYRFNNLLYFMVLTDGTKFLADEAKCYWLMDLIGSYQLDLIKAKQAFQVWKLNVADSSGEVSCSDGNGNMLARQEIPYTDFPLSSISLYVEVGSLDGENVLVILLPSEH